MERRSLRDQVDGAVFNLTGARIRAGSEHTFRGERRPLEIQLEHTRMSPLSSAILFLAFTVTSAAGAAESSREINTSPSADSNNVTCTPKDITRVSTKVYSAFIVEACTGALP